MYSRKWPIRNGWHLYMDEAKRYFLVFFYRRKGCFYPRNTPLKSKKHWNGEFIFIYPEGTIPKLDATSAVHNITEVFKDKLPNDMPFTHLKRKITLYIYSEGYING